MGKIDFVRIVDVGLVVIILTFLFIIACNQSSLDGRLAALTKESVESRLAMDKIGFLENVTLSDLRFVERAKLYNPLYNATIVEKLRINGYYNSNQGFYCVWTKDRTSEDIGGTDGHEACHALVSKDTLHFCQKYVNETGV